MNEGSASVWRRASRGSPAKGTATASTWREAGYQYRYQFNYARLRAEIAKWAEGRQGRPPKTGEPLPVFYPPDGQYPMSLFRVATSYPFLKTAWAITSLRGNTPGPDGRGFYENFQVPDFGDRSLRS